MSKTDGLAAHVPSLASIFPLALYEIFYRGKEDK